MILIDKEKLLEDLKSKRYSKRSLELIENQPEVKAIPVKWIEDYIAGYIPGNNPSGEVEYMLEDWKEYEKGNEINN